MITQAMILSAGKGTRMRPLTLTTPKPLVTVGDKPLIAWHIERLKSAGITDIVVNVGYLGTVLREALLAVDWGVRLHISDETVFDEPLETAGGIRYALDNGSLRNEPFVLINGDVWTDFELSALCQHKLSDELTHLVLVNNPEHNPDGDFILANGRVLTKPTDGKNMNVHAMNTHTFAGLSVLSPKVVADVAVGKPVPLAPLLKQAMGQVSEDNRIKSAITGELMAERAVWIDVGTLERLAVADSHARALG